MTMMARALLLAATLATLTTACATSPTEKVTPGAVGRDQYGRPVN